LVVAQCKKVLHNQKRMMWASARRKWGFEQSRLSNMSRCCTTGLNPERKPLYCSRLTQYYKAANPTPKTDQSLKTNVPED